MWQKEYKKKKFYWGLEQDKGLEEAIKYAPRGVALDIGAGEGRNSIFLAKNGFKVEAIDKIPEGLEKCKKIAKKYSLPIKTKVVNVRKFKFEKDKYSLIISIAALDFLKLKEIKQIIKKINYALKLGGIFYLSLFSIKDPAFKKCRKELKLAEKNTFYIPKIMAFRHFFEKKELLNLLNKFKILKIEEKRIRDIYNGKIHFHQIIRIIAKK